MRRALKGLKWVAAAFIVLAAALGGWLYFAPPELIRLGAAYTAKIVCSNVLVAERDPGEVLAVDVQAPGHPLLRLMAVTIDDDARTASAGLLGVFGRQSAAMRGKGLGCSSVPDRDIERARASAGVLTPPKALPDGPWPIGNRVEAAQNPRLTEALNDPDLAGPGLRAIVVVHDGRIVAERYGRGFSATTPLLGWSMTKTVNAAIAGTLVKAGRLRMDQAELFQGWRGAGGGGRAAIRFEDLMSMSSGLAFDENYGEVTDVTRMLFLEPDMSAFAAAKPLKHPVSTVFNYSSGSAVLLSRLWQDAAGADALSWPREALFEPLGMTSAVLEMDSRGTFVGSSYLYATARDWARFGQFLLQDGSWNGRELLPPGFVAWMRQPAPASGARYGKGQLWLKGPGGGPDGGHSDGDFGLPADTYWLQGHDGQTTAIVPSRNAVVVRLGLTPGALGYRPQKLLAAVLQALD